MNRIGLVMEGGGLRSVFSAGILDYFMEQNFYLPYVIGVSAGAYSALCYKSKQPGRLKLCNIDYLKTGKKYLGIKYLLKNRNYYDMELLFDHFPNRDFPFDYQTFYTSPQKLLIVTTDCVTGRPLYIDPPTDHKKLMEVCRASNSLPLISSIVTMDGVPMLDGGMSDAIPIRKAIADGMEKSIVILTRQKGYIKPEESIPYQHIVRLVYHKYPHFAEAVINRPRRYNQTIEYLEKLEEEGKVFILRPQAPIVRMAEQDPKLLYACYKDGYDYAVRLFPEILRFTENSTKH